VATLQKLHLLASFHAFGNDANAEALSDADDAVDNRRCLTVFVHVAHEGAIELDPVNAELPQMTKRRIIPTLLETDTRPFPRAD
jgi:hypothetical protein